MHVRRGAEIVCDWVGLRPGRTTLRLELEHMKLLAPAAGSSGGAGVGREAAMPVVHNYGHGGAGLTLAWGCAGDASALLAGALDVRVG